MPKSKTKARAVRQKTREVVEFHRDTERPGKPLHLIIPGGLLALAALLAIFGVIHKTWVDHVWEESQGIGTLVLLVPVYIGSVFTFSYGYELYDMDRALKLTGWIVGLTIGIVVVVAVLFSLASGDGEENGKSRSKKKKEFSSGGRSLSSSSSSSSTGDWFASSGSSTTSSAPLAIDLNLFSNSRVAPVAAAPAEPPRPEPIACKFCQSEFIPEETEFKCPSCGASSSRTESDQSSQPS